MPTKRRIIIFFIVLGFMLLVKLLHGQEVPTEQVGWDPIDTSSYSAEAYGTAAIVFGAIFGMAAGAGRAINRHHAARRGVYFTGDLTVLHLQ
jgi:hypothetical protein